MLIALGRFSATVFVVGYVTYTLAGYFISISLNGHDFEGMNIGELNKMKPRDPSKIPMGPKGRLPFPGHLESWTFQDYKNE